MKIVCCLAVLAVLSLGLAAPAHAEKPVEQAKREFAAGRSAFDSGDYELAIKRFASAEAIAPSPVLSYNIGLAYERLGRDGEAVQSFSKCLEALLVAPKLDRRLHQNAKQHLVDARAREARRKPPAVANPPKPRPGVLEFRETATAAGGQIFIDGVAHGDVPGRVEVAAGNHRIEVRRAGFVSYRHELVLAEGEARPLHVDLEPEKRTSTIRVEPDPEKSAPKTSTIKVESAR